MAILRQRLDVRAELDLSLGGSAPAVGPVTKIRQYYDTATRRLYASLNGDAFHVSPFVMGTAAASATVANTTTPTTFLGTVTGSKTVAAGALVVGKTLSLRAWGVLSSTGTPNLTIAVKLGSVTVATTGIVAQTGTPVSVGWELECVVTCRTVGASGTVFAQGCFRYGSVFMPLAATAAVTVDTTAAGVIDTVCTWSVAAAGNTLTGTNCLLEVLN